MIVLDTTVLVYAVGDDHPLGDPCRALIAAIGNHEQAATTTVEAIQEFVHVRARRRSRHDAADLARHYATLLAPLLQPDDRDLADGLSLYTAMASIGAFDAVLAATVLNREDVTALVSADASLAEVPGLHVLNPAEPGFAERWSPSARG